MTTPRKILFALDESNYAISALSWTFKNILRKDDKLIVISIALNDESKVAIESRVKTLIAAVRDSFKSLVVEVTLRVIVSTKQGQSIVEFVEVEKPDFLVLGASGKGTVKGFLVGSCSAYCVQNANCPVICARLLPSEANNELKKKGSKSSLYDLSLTK